MTEAPLRKSGGFLLAIDPWINFTLGYGETKENLISMSPLRQLRSQ